MFTNGTACLNFNQKKAGKYAIVNIPDDDFYNYTMTKVSGLLMDECIFEFLKHE
jgi:hypothetical protein